MVVFAADKKASQATFESVVGQRDLKDGLLAVAADDGLDGLLIRGEKGTAKSTTVRALADLLPEQRAVADCPYSCPPAAPSRQCSDCREREEPPVGRPVTEADPGRHPRVTGVPADGVWLLGRRGEPEGVGLLARKAVPAVADRGVFPARRDSGASVADPLVGRQHRPQLAKLVGHRLLDADDVGAVVADGVGDQPATVGPVVSPVFGSVVPDVERHHPHRLHTVWSVGQNGKRSTSAIPSGRVRDTAA